MTYKGKQDKLFCSDGQTPNYRNFIEKYTLCVWGNVHCYNPAFVCVYTSKKAQVSKTYRISVYFALKNKIH